MLTSTGMGVPPVHIDSVYADIWTLHLLPKFRPQQIAGAGEAARPAEPFVVSSLRMTRKVASKFLFGQGRCHGGRVYAVSGLG